MASLHKAFFNAESVSQNAGNYYYKPKSQAERYNIWKSQRPLSVTLTPAGIAAKSQVDQNSDWAKEDYLSTAKGVMRYAVPAAGSYAPVENPYIRLGVEAGTLSDRHAGEIDLTRDVQASRVARRYLELSGYTRAEGVTALYGPQVDAHELAALEIARTG